MKSNANQARLPIRAFALLGALFLSVNGVFAQPPANTQLNAKQVGLAVSSAATAVDAAVRAETQVKAAIGKLGKATPATATAEAETLRKAKASLEEARKTARTRLDKAAELVALVQVPKGEVDKLKKRIADLNAKLAGIPSY